MNQPHTGVPNFLLLILSAGNHYRRELCEAKETAAVVDQCIIKRPIVFRLRLQSQGDDGPTRGAHWAYTVINNSHWPLGRSHGAAFEDELPRNVRNTKNLVNYPRKHKAEELEFVPLGKMKLIRL